MRTRANLPGGTEQDAAAPIDHDLQDTDDEAYHSPMSEAAAPPAATAGSGGGGGGGTGEAQAQAQGTSESASESESGSEVEVDPNDIEEDEDDEDEEEDDDEEDDDEGSSDEEYDSEGEEEEDELASVSLRALLASLPLLADYTPPPLDNDLAEELAARTGAAAARGGAPRAGTPCARHGGQRVVSPAAALALRETGGGGGGGGGAAGCGTHIAAFHRLPTRATAVVDRMQSRGYIGRFTSDGEIFVAAFQSEKRIRMYDVHRGWSLLKDVHARSLRWTVTDTALSSDQRFLLYSSITPTVHLVKVDRAEGATQSVANITDIHEALHFGTAARQSNGIWSLAWSGDNREIIAGTADQSLYVYDVAAGRTVVTAVAGADDVNAVAYADESSQMIFTGCDDHEVKVWDRRLLGAGGPTAGGAVGVFLGHNEGITHLDSKGDGRYLISNSKDQSIKLWDVRAMRTPRAAARIPRRTRSFQWDYRWMPYPATGRLLQHPHDGAVATYRGHSVLGTLIRAYWSPEFSTGQRYIYSGSSDGAAVIYDVVGCQPVARLRSGGRETVRDCSWHPFLPLLATVSFDGSVTCFEPEPAGDLDAAAEEAEVVAERRAPGTGGAAGRAVREATGRLLRPRGDQLGEMW